MISVLKLLISCMISKVSVVKTIQFNFRYLPLKIALKLPVYIYRNVKMISLKGKVLLKIEKDKISQGMILIGYEYEPSFNHTILNLQGGTMVFRGQAYISRGTKLTVFGLLVFGAWSGTSYDVAICCLKKIVFGSVTLIGFGSIVTDSDNHPIFVDGKISNYNKEIVFGDHNWIASKVIILKGTILGNNNVVGTGSLINKAFPGDCQLIVGNPAKVVRTNIHWEENFNNHDRIGNPPGYTIENYE